MTEESKLHTVTGATGYTGRYITKLLLERGHRVQSLTGHPERESPFGDRVRLRPFDFDDPYALRRSLLGTHTLFNTYWIRVNHKGRTHQECVEQTRTLFGAARESGVKRIVHISITNPDPDSDLPYFRGKGQLEDELRNLGLSYAILRPTVLYSVEDVLLNNIAWTLRKFPVTLIPGRGNYGIQPVFVEDLAELAVSASEGSENVETDAVGPEVFSYRELNELVRRTTGARCLILPAPKWAAYAAGKMLGTMMGDIVITKDEIKGLERDLLVSRSPGPAPCRTRLSEWLEQNGPKLGRKYASETARHYR